MKKDSFLPAYIAFGLLTLIICIGTLGYIFIEDFSFGEAFYMTIITMATVGFEEVHQLSPVGMWFTSFLIIISFGIFAYAVTTFTKFVVDGVSSNYFKDKRMQRKIDKLRNHVIICGYGRNGRQAALELNDHAIPFIVIERDEAIVEEVRNNTGIYIIQGDSTQDEVLKLVNIEKARALITTMPADSDNLYVVLSAKHLNPELKIISRASEDNSDNKLKSAGATSVIMPDRVGGRRMAKLVAHPDVVEFMEYIMMQGASEVILEEICCDEMDGHFDGKSISELDIRNESGANIIGLKREDKSFVINPPADIILSSKDKLFILGTINQIKKLKSILFGKHFDDILH